MTVAREIKNRADFGDLLNEMGLTGMAAEIGVYRGEFSRVLLDRWAGRRLFLVDPWCKLDEYANDAVNAGDRDADFDACMALLDSHRERCTILPTTSTEAAKHLAGQAFDFVYIDANHNEPFVRQDLALWYPLVRSGGIFAGHDYLSTVTWPGVQRAVNDFAAANGIAKINLTWETGGSWWWVKP